VLQVSVLGPVEVRRDGAVLAIPGGKTAELLVRLALDAGVLVRTERLLDDLWAADAVHTRRNTLQAKVAKLRRALGDGKAIVHAGGGYTLALAPSAVDAHAVVADAAEAARRLTDGDHAGAAARCGEALARFRGDLLPVAEGEWAAPHRARLDGARAALVETRMAARLHLGAFDDVVGELEAAVTTDPFQEGLWELLMTALYRAGRQSDALQAYERVRRLLAEELGLRPGPRLQALERRVLQQDASLDGAAPARAGATASFTVGNLPSMAAELVGRGDELSALAGSIAAHRLVEVLGPGGIGKTALAIETARRLSAGDGVGTGGVWLVRLEGTTTPDEVVDAVIAALGVAGGESGLLERLKARPALLVLDNCEHVLDAAADLVVRLLDAAPGTRILCTSQVPLGVDGEAVVELAPLALADAVQLFVRRAATQGRHRPPPADGALEELCRSLDGLPLAIELAAARTRTLSIAEIRRRLDDRFTILSDPTSRKPERRRALRSTIAWSYELLFPDDQRGLWALSCFAGGASLPAVEHVLAALDVPASAALDVVGRLAGRSLVITEAEDADGSVRYRLLDSIRAFALEAMRDAQLADRASAAHAAWFADRARTSTAGVRSRRQAEHLALVRAERANVDAALSWSSVHDPLLALEIANGFGWAWIVLGDSRGSQRILAALEAAGTGATVRDRATALLLAAWIEASTGHIELAHRDVAAASALAEEIGDDDLRARCCYHLAYVVSHEGHWERAMELTDRSRALYDPLDRPWDQAANALFASRAAISAGDEPRAVAARDRVQHLLRSVDDPWLHVRRDAMLGELARVQHRFDDAVRHIAHAAETSHRLGFLQTEAYQVSSLGRAQCQAGDHEAGAATLERAIGQAEATGDLRLAALARVHLGRVLRALGHDDRARVALEAASAWHRDAGGGEQAALGECLLAALDAVAGVDGAPDRLEAILEEARHRADAAVEVFALDALARIRTGAGALAAGRELCEEADRRMAAASHFITDLDRTDARHVRVRTRGVQVTAGDTTSSATTVA
jgi:predicted ATPase/DNA-binding SARP family transcriptional activator